jgi:hypothetical protein
MANLGGGPYNGYVSKQTNNVSRDSGNAMARRILRDSWNHAGALGVDHGKNRIITPFRGVMNLGDFLGRQNYVCGGPAQYNRNKPGYRNFGFVANCDQSGVPAASCNTKFVADSSLYTRFRKERSINQNYNDGSNSNDLEQAKRLQAAYIRAVRRR